MSSVKVNETPVRTSKSFNINNIKISEDIFSNKIPEFNNVEIVNNSTKVSIENEKTPVELKYGLGESLTTEVEKNSNQNYKITIDSKTNKETLIIKYETLNEIISYHNGIIKLNAKHNSKINIIIVNLLSDKSNNFLSIESKIEKDANVNYIIVDFGGENTVTNYYSNLAGDFAKNSLNTLYIGKEKQVIDLNYIAELYGKKSEINIEVQGALKDKAKKNFKGTIDFKKGCKKAKGEENENCVLLSDTTKSIALPMLLCSEEDVEGAHSSSAGKVGDKELFYIMSRGFELKEAQKLLIRANFNKILENIKNEGLKERIIKEIDLRLD